MHSGADEISVSFLHTLQDSPLLSQGPLLVSRTFSRDPVNPGTDQEKH